jgi:RNA polymerase sigma-70 factor, ECF subfamily
METSEGIPLGFTRAGAGEQAAAESGLERIFRAQYPRLINLLARITGDRAPAEELASEVFCKLAARPALFRPNNNLEGWLYRTAMNLGLDWLKMHARRKKHEQAAAIENGSDVGGMNRGPLDSLIRDEERRRVRSVLAGLKPISARILLLRHVGFSYRELARTLKLNPASVGQLLVRATTEFKTQYCALYKDQHQQMHKDKS